jgi:hypothetical protein
VGVLILQAVGSIRSVGSLASGVAGNFPNVTGECFQRADTKDTLSKAGFGGGSKAETKPQIFPETIANCRLLDSNATLAPNLFATTVN